jgi:peptide/nickel transport system substrate-binding protein
MRKVGKKDIILLILGVALIISVAGNGVLIFNNPQQYTPRDPLTLVVGTSSGPHTLEIVDCWDSRSEDVLGQVVETLFTNDLYDPNLPRINLLAESYWWENTTTLHIKLREGILFHDGTPFNASAAKWNLDRLQFLTNAWGNNTGEIAHTSSMFMRPDEITPIINDTVTNGEYNITITLNGVYGPFLNMLTLINTGMISPTTHQNVATSFIELDTGKLVGTGPFIYEHYTPDVEVIFSRWNEYWGHVAYFKKLQYRIIYDAIEAKTELLNGKIDYKMWVDENILSLYEEDNSIIVKHYTDDTGIPGLDYYYLGFNNQKINQTWRKAITWAINYSYILKELLFGTKVRSVSPISLGYGNAYNVSVPSKAVPNNGNVTYARMVVQSMGFGTNLSLSDDSAWIAQTFLTYDYIHNPLNTFMSDLGIAIFNWLHLIGVAQNDWMGDSNDYLNYLFDHPDYLGIFPFHYEPYYLDPYIILDWLVNPISGLNSAQINDTNINNMMVLALQSTDDIARNQIYKNIQGYMVEEGYFQAPLYHSKVYFVHSADLRNVPYNAIRKFQAHGIWRE